MPIADAAAYKLVLWIADAATAVLKAIESVPSGIYDVVEDSPTRQHEAAAALAAAVGRRKAAQAVALAVASGGAGRVARSTGA